MVRVKIGETEPTKEQTKAKKIHFPSLYLQTNQSYNPKLQISTKTPFNNKVKSKSNLIMYPKIPSKANVKSKHKLNLELMMQWVQLCKQVLCQVLSQQNKVNARMRCTHSNLKVVKRIKEHRIIGQLPLVKCLCKDEGMRHQRSLFLVWNDDSDSEPDYHHYESKDLHSLMSSDYEKDMIFAIMDEFKRVVKKYNIQIGRSIKFSRTFVDQHICTKRHNNKFADKVWVTEMLEENIRDQQKITCAEAKIWFKREFNVAINYKI
ncbi:hypothetical protein Ahy_A10g048145 isoform A [Arachis hypogaea]|uniref:Uncharacterized protein n=1 Tax=Arachis hypogaea TaxID=3818 RepID=A0A445B4D1_ARAHY|nr:hypothetical protein Ahy_A10g048145 isoform A [Arachis hypogaea]